MKCVVCGHENKKRVCNTCDVTVLPSLHHNWFKKVCDHSLCEEWRDYMTYRRFYFSVIDPEVGGYLRVMRTGELLGPDNYQVGASREYTTAVKHGMSSHKYFQTWWRWKRNGLVCQEWEDAYTALAELDEMPKDNETDRPRIIDKSQPVCASNVMFKPQGGGRKPSTVKHPVLNNRTFNEAVELTGVCHNTFRGLVKKFTTFECLLAEYPRIGEKLL